jgi:hypothetical protein
MTGPGIQVKPCLPSFLEGEDLYLDSVKEVIAYLTSPDMSLGSRVSRRRERYGSKDVCSILSIIGTTWWLNLATDSLGVLGFHSWQGIPICSWHSGAARRCIGVIDNIFAEEP